MTLWAVPLAFTGLVALLVVATVLEQRRVRMLVRLTMRSRAASPDRVEALVAAELAPVLAQHGFTRR